MLHTTILQTLLLLLTTLTCAVPTLRPKTCPNHLTNPSFETGTLTPWLPIVTSAWSPTRGVTTSPPSNRGNYFYHAHATSSVEATLTLSQSGIAVPVGSVVECYAWISTRRSENVTSVEVFLDGVSCGRATVGEGDEGWRRVGGWVGVMGGMEGVGSTLAVVAGSEAAGADGWDVWIDEVGVVGC